MRREVNMKALYKVMILMAVVLFIGTAGAVDNEIIPLGMAALQIVLTLGLGIVGGYGCRLEDRREQRRK